MPRGRRLCVGGICYHVINRGNRRATVFHDADDYDQFIRLLARAHRDCPMRIVAYCLMPNHFHLVAWPLEDGDLSRFLHLLTSTHVRRYHRRYGTVGRVWQERFKSFPIQQDGHLLRVLRYVERNPVRAGLARSAADWAWSSVAWWKSGRWPGFGDPGPVERPAGWERELDGTSEDSEIASVRRHLERGRPFGEPDWIETTAKALGLEGTLRPRGRPVGSGRVRVVGSGGRRANRSEKGASPL